MNLLHRDMANQAPTFDDLWRAGTWEPIPNCTGRYRMSSGETTRSLSALVGDVVPIQKHRVRGARDFVFVANLVDGGVISYLRPNGTYLHTLNTGDGFYRKLAQLGIAIITAT